MTLRIPCHRGCTLQCMPTTPPCTTFCRRALTLREPPPHYRPQWTHCRTGGRPGKSSLKQRNPKLSQSHITVNAGLSPHCRLITYPFQSLVRCGCLESPLTKACLSTHIYVSSQSWSTGLNTAQSPQHPWARCLSPQPSHPSTSFCPGISLQTPLYPWSTPPPADAPSALSRGCAHIQYPPPVYTSPPSSTDYITPRPVT